MSSVWVLAGAIAVLGTDGATHAAGYRDGCAEAREEPVIEWALGGAGASLLSSGCLVPLMPPVAFLLEKPEGRIDGLDETRGEEYAAGYRKGYDQTLKSRRGIAAFSTGAVVALTLAIGLGLVEYYRADPKDPEDAEASLAAPPALFRF